LKSPRSIIWLAIILTASCAEENTDPAIPAQRRSLSQRLDEKNSYKVDADGNWTPTNDRRSSFESQGDSPYFKGKYEKKEYKSGEYAKKSWWGNKDYGKKSYDGNTDGSQFQKSSRFDGKGARETGTDSGRPIPTPPRPQTKPARRASTKLPMRKRIFAATFTRHRKSLTGRSSARWICSSRRGFWDADRNDGFHGGLQRFQQEFLQGFPAQWLAIQEK
jgi:hypothetical protein